MTAPLSDKDEYAHWEVVLSDGTLIKLYCSYDDIEDFGEKLAALQTAISGKQCYLVSWTAEILE